MSDTSFTILEVHLGDGDIQIGPFGLDVAPGEQAEVAGEPASDEEDETETGGKGGRCSVKSIVGVVLAMGLLAAAAIAATKFLGDDEKAPSGTASGA
ncbi:hypothetical protein [Halorubrum sp. DTA46]|uniref:hypothetical protein n=1 Tax=Halorubrum sp. DTA46 TaxID=3402162 RepID=UPI003AAA786C